MAIDSVQVHEKALAVLEEYPEGMEWSNLLDRLIGISQDFTFESVHARLWKLCQDRPEEVYKPAPGFFRLVKYKDFDGGFTGKPIPGPVPDYEMQYVVARFADWLMNQTEECTKAVALEPGAFTDAWATPGIVGIRKPRQEDLATTPLEIVSVEITDNDVQPDLAFGKACAYRLFSHKVYLVIPQVLRDDLTSRMDSLCHLHGIGFVDYYTDASGQIYFDIRVRPRYQEMDLFYANKYIKLIEKQLWG